MPCNCIPDKLNQVCLSTENTKPLMQAISTDLFCILNNSIQRNSWHLTHFAFELLYFLAQREKHSANTACYKQHEPHLQQVQCLPGQVQHQLITDIKALVKKC